MEFALKLCALTLNSFNSHSVVVVERKMSASILERLRSDYELAELNEEEVGNVLAKKPNGVSSVI